MEEKMLKLRLSYFGHITRRQDSLEKTIMLGKAEGSKKRRSPKTRWIESLKQPVLTGAIDLKQLFTHHLIVSYVTFAILIEPISFTPCLWP